jgi:hypothetical protein
MTKPVRTNPTAPNWDSVSSQMPVIKQRTMTGLSFAAASQVAGTVIGKSARQTPHVRFLPVYRGIQFFSLLQRFRHIGTSRKSL